jgi:hypothetical protein
MPLPTSLFDILRVKRTNPPTVESLFQSKAGQIRPVLVDIGRAAIRIRKPDDLGGKFNERAIARFTL